MGEINLNIRLKTALNKNDLGVKGVAHILGTVEALHSQMFSLFTKL